jgi:2-polyprenyl-6-methoxyphenol hydroxylase-like FAD-dependent oxidoreductase
MMNPEQVSVLIVGGGAAGLSLLLLLQQRGVRATLVERREDVSWYPRARNLNFRSLEVFRGLGLCDQIRRAGQNVSRLYAREHLVSGEQKLLIDPAEMLDTRRLSPDPFVWYCPQSRLEPLLLEAARKHGADVRYATELTDFTQDETGVSATLRRRPGGGPLTLRSQFLVGADGAHSRIRETLRIATQGKGKLDEHWVFIYFRVDLGEFVRGNESDGILIQNADVRGIVLLPEKNLGMFILMQEKAEELSHERALDVIKRAIGNPELSVDLVEVAPWQPEQHVADQFQEGRVLLLGDAAHTMPPKEGLGANTAIQSAQNLAWKLASVLQQNASTELLATYQAERRPVAWYAAQHSMTGPAAAMLDRTPSKEKASEFFPIVGYRYRSPAILSEPGPEPPEGEIALLDRTELTGGPGTRVPHVWLQRNSQRISTLDLFDGRFVLLTGSDAAPWCDAVRRSALRLGIELRVYEIGPNGNLQDVEGNWNESMGVPPDGVVLVRPDSFVAWRGSRRTHTPERLVEHVLARVLHHPTASVVSQA